MVRFGSVTLSLYDNTSIASLHKASILLVFYAVHRFDGADLVPLDELQVRTMGGGI